MKTEMCYMFSVLKTEWNEERANSEQVSIIFKNFGVWTAWWKSLHTGASCWSRSSIESHLKISTRTSMSQGFFLSRFHLKGKFL